LGEANLIGNDHSQESIEAVEVSQSVIDEEAALPAMNDSAADQHKYMRVDDFKKLCGDKHKLYIHMTFKGKWFVRIFLRIVFIGKLRLPIETMVPTAFLMQVLDGSKQVYDIDAVLAISIPVNRFTTKKKLARLIELNHELKAYFPDNPITHCDRQFMVDVINTYDPEFFKGALEEVNTFLLENAKKKNQTVPLSSRMYGILQKMNDEAGYAYANAKQSKFVLPPKKRKRHQALAVPELSTSIRRAGDPMHQMKRRKY